MGSNPTYMGSTHDGRVGRAEVSGVKPCLVEPPDLSYGQGD
jgi:hypothetical protein